MYIIEGRHQKQKIVNEYVARLCVALNIHRFTARGVGIVFMNHCDGDAQGLCSGDKEVAVVHIAKKGYTHLEQMKTLAHEMVHARQFLRGQLTCEGGFAWKGRKADGFEYMNQPWEKEAYRLENELFVQCYPFDME